MPERVALAQPDAKPDRLLSSTRHQVNRCDRIFGTHLIYYQYKADRCRRTLRGIDEQVAKAEQAVAGKTR